jgi:hypothetical protein
MIGWGVKQSQQLSHLLRAIEKTIAFFVSILSGGDKPPSAGGIKFGGIYET